LDYIIELTTKPVFSEAQRSQTGFGPLTRNQFSHSLALAAEIGWIGGNLFSVERSETKQVSSYDLLNQTGFGTQARNQFSHSLTLMAEIGLLGKNLFSGFQTGFSTQARNQFSHSLALVSEIGLLGENITPEEEEKCVAPFTVYC